MTTQNANYDHLVKVVIIGSSGVGKSSLLSRYVDDIFSSTFISTIGVDFKVKTVEYNGKQIKIQIWDTAGQERFRSIVSSYYRGAHGAIVVYDVTDAKTFKPDLPVWLAELERYKSPDAAVFVAANKVDDAEHAVVKPEDVKAYLKEFNESFEHKDRFRSPIRFSECSAKTNVGVNELFLSIVGSIYDTRFNSSNDGKSNTVSLTGSTIPDGTVKSSCC